MAYFACVDIMRNIEVHLYFCRVFFVRVCRLYHLHGKSISCCAISLSSGMKSISSCTLKLFASIIITVTGEFQLQYQFTAGAFLLSFYLFIFFFLHDIYIHDVVYIARQYIIVASL